MLKITFAYYRIPEDWTASKSEFLRELELEGNQKHEYQPGTQFLICLALKQYIDFFSSVISIIAFNYLLCVFSLFIRAQTFFRNIYFTKNPTASFEPPGPQVMEFSHKNKSYAIHQCNGETPHFRKYLERLQPFLVWTIEAANYLGIYVYLCFKSMSIYSVQNQVNWL